MEEKRKHPRAPLVVKVVNKATKEFHYFYSRDISQGGMFLETREPYKKGTEVELDFFVPLREQKERVITRGVVVRTFEYSMEKDSDIVGMGIEFDGTESKDIGLLARYVRETLED